MQRLAALIPRPRLQSDPLPWRARTQCQAASRDHSNRAGQRPYPLSGPRRGAPCRSAGAHELGPVGQAGVRYRPGTLPPLRRPLEDHRRHRTSPRHRQDPHPPRLARPGTAPIPGQGLPPIPTGLTSHGSPIPSGSAPEPTAALGLCPPETLKRPRNIAPRADERPHNAPVPGRGPVCLTAHEPRSTVPPEEKVRLKYLCSAFEILML